MIDFGAIDQKKLAFSFKILNTIEDEEIKSSGGWEKCEKIREEVINDKNIKVYAIDGGYPEIKVITHKNKSYIFMHYFKDDDTEIINKIISSFKFNE
jgi:hypothetical protein